MNILVIDIGGTNVKLWTTGAPDKVKYPSGKTLSPQKLLELCKPMLSERKFDRISIGYPGEVLHGRPVHEPYNLATGWCDFDFLDAFDCPVRMMNDASMQALGSYDGGRMLYLGLGTSVGTVFISDGKIVPLALGHLLLNKNQSFEQSLNRVALKENRSRWTAAVANAAKVLKFAFLADYVMLGGGNSKKIETLPEYCRRGGNFNAYIGGLRLWDDALHLDDYSARHREAAPELHLRSAIQ